MSGERPILLVEDNPDDVDLALRAFKRAGVTRRVDVVEALDDLFFQGPYAARAGQPAASRDGVAGCPVAPAGRP
ncbi:MULTISPECIES: hypothetical protein [Myxococcus]|uniref:hypothetical protein n=1 Tax=Myxococcus TaxID=32 RepID=UPI001F1C580F|nr:MULTISPECIES: hypothetical protein [Myxococcus]WAM26766.1 hypothetical protein OZ403_01205 [Myxococcus sp. NMCA1]